MAGGPPSTGGVPPLRRNRDFLLLWTGAGFSQLGAKISVIAFPLLLVWHGDSALGAGLVAFAGLLPALLLQLPAGVLVDRWDRRRLMVGCDALASIAMLSVAVAVLFGVVWLPHLLVVNFVEGACLIFYLLAQRAAVRNVVEPEHLPSAVARNEARGRVASLLGQPAGSSLFALLSWLPFAAVALGHLVALVSLLFVRRPLQTERVDRPLALRRDIGEGLRWLWEQKFLRAATVMVAATNFFAQVVNLVPLVVIKQTGGSAALAGLVGLVGGVGGVCGALFGGVLLRKLSLGGVLLLDLATRAALVPVMAFATALPLLFAPFALMSFTGAVLNVGAGAYMARVVPDEMQGRAMSAVMLTSWGANSAGALVAGVLLSTLTTTSTLLCVTAGLVVLLVGAVLSPTIRRSDAR
ncbi:MFS transporter [Saccharothrix yanglingensis]|uniref:MFS transporter n=1 Tax=Saccharothrix yanglingensis TaxID=659496 RepID=A0ABU0X3K1_9PSEU|nr:MFS transporter [Saccharothrix yanglingensis]